VQKVNVHRLRSVQERAYRRAAKSASGLSVDTIEGVDEEVVVKVEMRER
jgi:hypothetical protein